MQLAGGGAWTIGTIFTPISKKLFSFNNFFKLLGKTVPMVLRKKENKENKDVKSWMIDRTIGDHRDDRGVL
jgi:hypothetical protein